MSRRRCAIWPPQSRPRSRPRSLPRPRWKAPCRRRMSRRHCAIWPPQSRPRNPPRSLPRPRWKAPCRRRRRRRRCGSGRRRAGLAVCRGHSTCRAGKRHVAARAAAAAGCAAAEPALQSAAVTAGWKASRLARAAVRRCRAGLAIRRGHSPSHAGKRYVAAERAAHGTIARAAARKCHAIAATPAASDPHCDAAACGPSSCVASSA